MSDSEGGGPPLELLRSATFDWTNTLSARLEQEGVPHQVLAVGARTSDGLWAVYVPPEELELAREIDREVMHELFPDLPEDYDPAALDTSRCPACQEPVPEGAASCPECGLALLEGNG